MSTHPNRPICRPIHIGLFQSREYRGLPDDGHARLLLLSLLIHPHGGTFHLPGLYQVGREGLREAASMPKRCFVKGFADLVRANLVEVDDEVRLVWVPAALALTGPPTNPNVVKGFARSLAQLPASPLVNKATSAYRTLLKPFGEAFIAPLENPSERLTSEGSHHGRKACQRLNSSAAGYDQGDERLTLGNANRNCNKDKNIHTHNNSLLSSPLANWILVAEYARNNGWKDVAQGRVEKLLKQSPNLTWADFLAISESVRGRTDLHDPVAYVFGVAKHQGFARRDGEAAELDGAELFMDGEEIAFDG